MGTFYKIALEIFGVSRIKIYWSPVLRCFISGFDGDTPYILVRECDFLYENHAAENTAAKMISKKWSYEITFQRVTVSPAEFSTLKIISMPAANTPA